MGDQEGRRLPQETVRRLRREQREIASEVVLRDLEVGEQLAGFDVAYSSGRGTCGGVVVDLESDEVVEENVATGEVDLPYVPTFFGFREAPLVLSCFSTLKVKPDCLLVHGHGLAHPERAGLACQVGVELPSRVTVGVAENPLGGDYEEAAESKGSTSSLLMGGEVVGAVVRTMEGANPVFVSPGNNVTVDTAASLVLSLARESKLPWPLVRADRLARRTASGA